MQHIDPASGFAFMHPKYSEIMAKDNRYTLKIEATAMNTTIK
jgi:hypothetical protein